MLPREVKGIESFKALQRGDILLFRPSPTLFAGQKWILFFQSLLFLEHGHYDTTHVAIVVDYDKEGPVIAHSYEVGEKRGYVKQTLQDMLNQEEKDCAGNGNRAFLVFRPFDQLTAEMTAKIAGDEEKNQHILWTYKQAAKTYFRFAYKGLSHQRAISEKKMPDEAICSQFVIAVNKTAEYQRFRQGEVISQRFNIRSSSTPKALEKYLYDDRNHYSLHVYTGDNAYLSLCQEIETQLERIKIRNKNELAREKYKNAMLQYQNTRQRHDLQQEQTELECCLELLRDILPILSLNTGWGFSTTSSNAVIQVARKLSIFERDILRYDLDHPQEAKHKIR